MHASNPWNYRNQARIKTVRQPGGEIAAGFFEAESHKLCPIDACLIISPRLNDILASLRKPECAVQLAACSEIELLADDRDERVMLTAHGSFNTETAEALARSLLASLPGVVTVACQVGHGWRVHGESALEYHVGEFNYRVSPTSFFQASRFLLPALVDAATAGGSGKLALDLFAGVGLLSLPLARRFAEVVAVEGHEPAARDLAANAESHSLGNLRSVEQSAFDFLRRFARAEPDLLMMDPPRAGVGARTLGFIAALRPRRIHYVSCHPPTLARDLAFLLRQGFTLNSIEMFDFFPQTYHIECLARLTRAR